MKVDNFQLQDFVHGKNPVLTAETSPIIMYQVLCKCCSFVPLFKPMGFAISHLGEELHDLFRDTFVSRPKVTFIESHFCVCSLDSLFLKLHVLSIICYLFNATLACSMFVGIDCLY